jgi:hypothetical protein
MRLYIPNSIRLSGGMMMIRPGRFNTYLLLAGVALGFAGCEMMQSSKNSEISTFRVHLQVNPDGTKGNEPVPVFREKPVLININKQPFLSEINVTTAKLVEAMGGFSMQVQLDRQGMWLLEQYTIANRGMHLVIFSQFGETSDKGRWLAAPLIKQRITDGMLTFTPDATREEADRIVTGLNNLVAKNKKKGL